jgi:hypothetical protein
MIGMPFKAWHAHERISAPIIEVRCQRQYLSLAISTLDRIKDSPEAYIVLGAYHVYRRPEHDCYHQALSNGRKYSHFWIKGAVFQGYEHGRTRNGTVVAMSNNYEKDTQHLGRCRFAAAFNRRVLVWSIDTDFLLRSLQNEMAFPKHFPIMLEPIELLNDAEICKLLWSDDKTLWAVTTNGIRQWRLGHMRGSRRETRYLTGPLVPGHDYHPRETF